MYLSAPLPSRTRFRRNSNIYSPGIESSHLHPGCSSSIRCRQTEPGLLANNLKFVSDVTIPDGTQANIGEAMEKKWEVENNGTCNWISGYTLRLVAGGSLGANPEQALYPALAGSKVAIQMNFLAPTAPGNYKSAWQAYGLDDKPFGEVIYIQIEVK